MKKIKSFCSVFLAIGFALILSSYGPECPDGYEAFPTLIPHGDCSKFWRCDNGWAIEEDCPAGLEFGPRYLVCDYPEQAGCIGGEGPFGGDTGSGGGYACSETLYCYSFGELERTRTCSGTRCESGREGFLSTPYIKCDGIKSTC